MDTPLPSAVHKENVHIGRGKATVLVKPDKIKAAGKDRKALADLRSTHGPAAGLSKVDLKLKSAIKGSEAKKNPMTQGRQQKAEGDLCTTKRHLVTGVSKGADLSRKSVPLSNLKGNGDLDHILTEEEIRQCFEWSNDGIEGMGGYSWSKKDERDLLMNQTLSEIMASAIGVPVAELEESFLSDEEGYETDGSDLLCSMSFPGRLSSIYTSKELDDPLGIAGIVLHEYPLPELLLDEDFNLDNDVGIDGR